MINGYAGKILRVDLSQKDKASVDRLDMKFAKKFLGGKGFGAKLLYDFLPPNVNPLSPQNLLMYCTGPITGTLAPCNRYCIVTKSPLTGTFNDSYAGGDFGQELKYAGYDIVIISGKAKKPVYLQILDDDIQVRDADHLWGLDTYETYKVLKRDMNDETAKVSCIGPAGENLVKIALVDCDYHRQAGRGGAGTVMGSKKLKAIVVRGTSGISVADRESLEKEVQKISQDMAISEKKSAHWLQRGEPLHS